jgi:hypothetical protein
MASRGMVPRAPRSSPMSRPKSRHGTRAEIGDTSAAAWQETLASLDAAHRDMVAVVLKLPASRLHEYVGATAEKPTGSGVSVGTIIRTLAEHDLYHCGQIWLLKRLARGALRLPQA